MNGLFITATDTGVGKTRVGAAIALWLRRQGLQPGIMKPAETGVADPAQPGEDAQLLAWSAQCGAAPELYAPWRLRQPLAPATAAAHEGRRLHFDELLHCAGRLAQQHDFLLVEGAGGVMVPLCHDHLMLDLPRRLQLPTLLVIRPGLGTINHTLLSLRALNEAGVAVAGWVINRMPAAPGTAEAVVIDTLSQWTPLPCLGVLPEVSGNPYDQITQLTQRIDRDAELAPLRRLLYRLGTGA